MNKGWNKIRQLKGSTLMGIYSKQLDVSLGNKNIVLHLVVPILKIVSQDSNEFWYWRLEWFEDEVGDDLLIINEQETPEPLRHTYEPDIAPNQHLVFGSYFSLENNTIKKVIGYGYEDKDDKSLTTLLFELEELYLTITAGPIIIGRILDKKPNNLGKQIFVM
ncbi:hypothetical protein [Ornithinibacillus sp. 179-J 7C1 HS]|uniref:hypothetical protein n=1 Tax=Ornithinibacillus sp. 179-J 7C1 HS TaxID=3142384 RepID=UPI0039A33A86